jgi:uncharacterized protein (TIGR02145 family)
MDFYRLRWQIESVLRLVVFVALACTFSCSSDDGDYYKTVKIGDQVWMAENLNYAVEGSKCYNNDPANCDKYGRLYNWSTAISICPSGWHLPSGADWEKLINYVENKNECFGCAGKYLKATSDWNEDGNGQDTYGFSALPGGIGNSEGNGNFRDIGEYGVWWSSSECYEYNAYVRLMYYDYDYAFYNVGGKEILLSVRCLQD